MRILVALLLIVCYLPPASARIYHYTNAEGRKVYVDSVTRIPPQYREQLDVRDEVKSIKSDTLMSEEEKLYQANREALMAQRKRISGQMKSLEMAVTIRSNLVIAPVKLKYGRRSVKLNMIMDTGASSTVVYRHTIKSLKAKFKRAGVVQVADGRTVPADQLRLDGITIGPYKSKGGSMLVMDNLAGAGGAAGLLGMDFLKQARYEIDFDREMLIWEPKSHREMQDLIVQIDERLEEIEEEQQALQAPDPQSQALGSR